ncbi:phage protease [Xanthobacter sp. KR7-225]|uniref:phage protease n=1 Tax=Xanthobacter sp. KR7-225 TaxID=3156613 RepID=UPI0032B404B7
MPEWLHLVPAGTFRGRDGRGPYVLDAQAVLADLAAGDKLAIDENHAIDKAAPDGRPSPARGWIVQLEQRADGIWGRVEWTTAGRQLMADQAYRGISPAIRVEKDTGRVIGIARASLVNDPNLALTTLHNRSHDPMDLTKLREALGLAADASEAAILAAIGKQKTDLATHQAQVTALGTALGLAAGATAEQVTTELQARQGDAPKLDAVKKGLEAAGIDWAKATATQIETHLRNSTSGDAQLRRTVIELQTSLETLQTETARKEATAFIDAAITSGKVGLKPMRDHYIARHMKEPKAVEQEIAAMPVLHMHGTRRTVPPEGQAGAVLTDTDHQVCELMGQDPKKFAETRKTETEAL